MNHGGGRPGERRAAEAGRLDVLFFVEDPGAANFLAPVVDAIGERGTRCGVLAAGLARDMLQHRKVAHAAVEDRGRGETLLVERAPRLVVIGTASNPDTLGLELVAAARERSVPSVGAVDAAMNSDARFRGHGSSPLAFGPEWLLVPDEVVAKPFIDLGMAADRVIVCGNPHYDYVMDLGRKWRGEEREGFRRRVFPNAPADAGIIVFVSEGSARVLGTPRERMAGYSFSGRGRLHGRSEIALEELLDALPAMASRPYVVLRAHPKDRCEDYATWEDEVDFISAGGDPLETVYAADLVVGTTTMLVTEAALLGRPTLALVPVRGEENWLPSVQVGATRVARTRPEIAPLLLDGLRSEACEAGLASLRGSRERATDALLQILERA